jgi:WD40 repeat protein
MIWDSYTGDLTNTLSAHTSGVHSVRFSPTKSILATKSWDNTIRIWQTETWNCIASINETSSKETVAPAFHPTGPVLATAGEQDTVVHIWRLDYYQFQT